MFATVQAKLRNAVKIVWILDISIFATTKLQSVAKHRQARSHHTTGEVTDQIGRWTGDDRQHRRAACNRTSQVAGSDGGCRDMFMRWLSLI